MIKFINKFISIQVDQLCEFLASMTFLLLMITDDSIKYPLKFWALTF